MLLKIMEGGLRIAKKIGLRIPGMKKWGVGPRKIVKIKIENSREDRTARGAKRAASGIPCRIKSNRGGWTLPGERGA